MFTDKELRRLASDLESDRVERKQSFKSVKDKIGEAICAYANDLPGHGQPGIILVGVRDNGTPAGLPITDELLQALGAYHSDGNILPQPNMAVEKRQLDGVDIAVIVVHPTGDPPVRYRGRVCIRVGPRRDLASRDEERVLTERRQSGDLPFDRRRIPLADLSSLDLDFFVREYLPAAVDPDVLAENQRTLEEQLAALHLLAPQGEPSASANLLLGKDPRQWIPGAYIQFVRYEGTEITAPILDQKELHGRMSEVLRRVDELAAINIRVMTHVEGATLERQRPDYPLAALQQITRNAVLHRTYEVHTPVYWYWFADRIEIHSPGGLYGRVNEQNFGKPGATDYRNPTIAEGLKILGFVQRFGMGIALARQRCHENGNPEPTFEFSPSSVLVTIRSAS